MSNAIAEWTNMMKQFTAKDIQKPVKPSHNAGCIPCNKIKFKRKQLFILHMHLAKTKWLAIPSTLKP